MGKTPSVLFRADAGLEIGTGHVMRCLTLADALGARGAKSTFVTRDHSGHIIPLISERGHSVIRLSRTIGQSYGVHPAPPPHSAWLQADWREDAATTRAIIQRIKADWLVVDHYALDRAWEEAALPKGVQLLTIDDLADRPHSADVLLDQNLGRSTDDYYGLVSEGCDLRIGPSYAILRPEFAHLRSAALARRAETTFPENLMITLGGIDRDNIAAKLLEVLDKTPVVSGMRITIIMGTSAPHIEIVRARAATMTVPTEVVVGATNMAELMMRADICIGAVGSTSWERCALGLPTLQVVLADNQKDPAARMAEQGLAIAIPGPDLPDFGKALACGLKRLKQVATYQLMAERAAKLTDAAGAERLTTRLLETIDVRA